MKVVSNLVQDSAYLVTCPGGSYHYRRAAANSAAVTIALPNNKERSDRLQYLELYSCKPPPLFLLLLSCSQVRVIVVSSIANHHTGGGLHLPRGVAGGGG